MNSSNELVSPQDTSLPGNLANSYSTPAFQVMGSFLDDLQVNFLLEATQMDKYSSIVQAPRIVMENGSMGYISVQSDIPYVEDIEVTVGEQAAGQEPTVEYMGFGTVLAVQAITRDLKYVNMYVVPQITQRDASADLILSVPIVAPGSVGSTTYTYPGKKTTRVETVVSVPDGGTLLIGGLKQNGEVEMEAGPPMLDKMPVIKRFFANNAKTRDNYTLMVLVKPKILVREETDPELSSKLDMGPAPSVGHDY
jgi:general secretion pathway protein D